MTSLPHSKFEAHIGFTPTYGNYLSAYREAIELLFQQIESGHAPVDTLAIPFLFMVRHSLEIGYKMNINYLSRYSNLDDKVDWDKHFLAELHEAFARHYMAVSEKLEVEEKVDTEFQEMHKKLGDLTTQLNKIDRGSFSFRYPMDLDQKRVFDHDEKINLLDVKETFDQAMILLFHTADVLSIYTDYHDYMNELMEQELRSAHSPW